MYISNTTASRATLEEWTEAADTLACYLEQTIRQSVSRNMFIELPVARSLDPQTRFRFRLLIARICMSFLRKLLVSLRLTSASIDESAHQGRTNILSALNTVSKASYPAYTNWSNDQERIAMSNTRSLYQASAESDCFKHAETNRVPYSPSTTQKTTLR